MLPKHQKGGYGIRPYGKQCYTHTHRRGRRPRRPVTKECNLFHNPSPPTAELPLHKGALGWFRNGKAINKRYHTLKHRRGAFHMLPKHQKGGYGIRPYGKQCYTHTHCRERRLRRSVTNKSYYTPIRTANGRPYIKKFMQTP